MALLDHEDSLEEAVRFDVEVARYKARQVEELESFIRMRAPKTGNEDFDSEAQVFVKAGGSFAYLLARRGGVLHAWHASTQR